MKNNIIISIFAFSLVLAITETGVCQKAAGKSDKPKVQRSAKRFGLQGEVTWISTTRDKIAVVYKKDEANGSEKEMLLPIAKDVQLEHVKSLEQIKKGDTVGVDFDEITEIRPDATETRREAKIITFIRSAAPPAPKTDTKPDEIQTLTSGGETN